jgi:hypothetical protein
VCSIPFSPLCSHTLSTWQWVSSVKWLHGDTAAGVLFSTGTELFFLPPGLPVRTNPETLPSEGQQVTAALDWLTPANLCKIRVASHPCVFYSAIDEDRLFTYTKPRQGKVCCGGNVTIRKLCHVEVYVCCKNCTSLAYKPIYLTDKTASFSCIQSLIPGK